jgi:hypothetical protein
MRFALSEKVALGSHHVVVFCILHQMLCNRLMRVTSIFFAIM